MIMVIVTMITVHGLEVTDTFVGGRGGGRGVITFSSELLFYKVP